MKLRIKGNSIRLRLTKTEIESIAENGIVTEETMFPNGSIFEYSLEIGDVETVQAIYGNSGIMIVLPFNQVKEWATSETVSIKTELETPMGEPLIILVEKDFKCLVDREGEEENDLFPNPNSEK